MAREKIFLGKPEGYANSLGGTFGSNAIAVTGLFAESCD